MIRQHVGGSFLSRLVLAFGALCLLGGCGGGDEGSGQFACQYEERTTDGCDGYGFGAWESECTSFNADDYWISAQEVCSNITDGGVHCEAGCCVDFEFRNVVLTSGSCP